MPVTYMYLSADGSALCPACAYVAVRNIPSLNDISIITLPSREGPNWRTVWCAECHRAFARVPSDDYITGVMTDDTDNVGTDVDDEDVDDIEYDYDDDAYADDDEDCRCDACIAAESWNGDESPEER